ncbi:glycine zipper family protein [methane-oxidizing endosymbiont of Gigantopelta aegis]|uniref:glycine zipper family protein n=1 Tax=methane-oxidizing endosymbiont of Gigantopelta aegis TaxID=2794938 RepID=UPI0018DCB61A|nr:glycine zipper family protein [methane-oxidizing endosymbiont of Gigantopelta aegis]
MKQKSLLVLISSLLLSACASQTGWSPTVDPYGDPNAYRLNQDMAECQQLAARASGNVYTETAKGAAVGGLVGAAAGAALGAISGDPGKGAAYGATIGGIGGASKQGFESDEQYRRAYINCMRHRGHYVVN